MRQPSSSLGQGAAAFDARESLRTSLRWGGAVAAAVAVFLLVLALSGALDTAAIASAIRALDAATLMLVLALSLVNYLLRGLRWHLLTREIAPTIPLGRNLSYYTAGFAFLVTPAKAGEIVRLWLLKSRHEVPYARSFSLMLVDRVADVAGLLLFAAVGLLSQSQHGMPLLATIAILALAVGALVSRRLVRAVVRSMHRLTGRRWPGPLAFALRTYLGLLKVCRPHVLVGCALLTLFAWAAQIAGLWLILRALGCSADFFLCAFVFAFSVLAGVVPLFPGGVGGAEAAMVGLLVVVGMTSEAAVTATVINRLATFWFALAIGLVAAPLVLAAMGRRPARHALDPAPGTT